MPLPPKLLLLLPRTTVPVLLALLIVRLKAALGSRLIASDTRATPGVYAIVRSSRVFTGIRPRTSILPPR